VRGLSGRLGTRGRPRQPDVPAGDRRTSYHATDERITIGIAAPDARERIAVLRRQLAKIGGSRGWTITEDLN
jgi:hypothetical protein